MVGLYIMITSVLKLMIMPNDLVFSSVDICEVVEDVYTYVRVFHWLLCLRLNVL